jgi:hypothetical protein
MSTSKCYEHSAELRTIKLTHVSYDVFGRKPENLAT